MLRPCSRWLKSPTERLGNLARRPRSAAPSWGLRHWHGCAGSNSALHGHNRRVYGPVFAVVAAAAWVATSSPRLSYFGVQIAVAFCLINLQEFRFQASLTIARDRVIGILLGLVMMWFFFDRLSSTNAGVAMKKKFVSVLRLLAQLARWEDLNGVEASVRESYELREAINVEFDQVRRFADAVLFEFGPSRLSDLEFRDDIRQWQPNCERYSLFGFAFLRYRLQTPGFELPESLRLRQMLYDQASARVLDELADQIEGLRSRLAGDAQERHELQKMLIVAEEEAWRLLPVAQAQSFTTAQ